MNEGWCWRLQFFVVTAVTVFPMVSICLTALVLTFKWHVNELSTGVTAVVVTIFCVSLLLAGIAVYGACCGGRCARMLLGMIFIGIGIGMVVLTIYLWVKQTDLMKIIGQAWENKYYDDVGSHIEEALKCKGWYLGINTCQIVVRKWMNETANTVGAILLILAVICGIGAFNAFNDACCRPIDAEGSTKETLGNISMPPPW